VRGNNGEREVLRKDAGAECREMEKLIGYSKLIMHTIELVKKTKMFIKEY